MCQQEADTDCQQTNLLSGRFVHTLVRLGYLPCRVTFNHDGLGKEREDNVGDYRDQPVQYLVFGPDPDFHQLFIPDQFGKIMSVPHSRFDT